MQGHPIGIPTLTAIDPEFNTPASGVGFAIPSNRVATILPQIISTGSVSQMDEQLEYTLRSCLT